MADTSNDGPIVLPLNSGVVRFVKIAGAERNPAGLGFWVGMMMVFLVIYGKWEGIYGLIIVVAWHQLWRVFGRRDPQYGAVLWRQWREYPWPARIQAWPGIGAKAVKIEPSVPVRGDK